MNKVNQFLADLDGPTPEVKDDILEAPITPEEGEEVKEDTSTQSEDKPKEEDIETEPEESVKNRRHKRLETNLASEREANIKMAARLEAMSEVNKIKEGQEDHYSELDHLYGNETPENIRAGELLKKTFRDVETRATERAVEQLREERVEEEAIVAKEETSLDTMIDDIEDENNITLTEKTKQGFFKELEKMSPKDAEGNVTAYADPNAVWGSYIDKNKRTTDTRAKELAARSMKQNDTSNDSDLQQTVEERYLKDNDII